MNPPAHPQLKLAAAPAPPRGARTGNGCAGGAVGEGAVVVRATPRPPAPHPPPVMRLAPLAALRALRIAIRGPRIATCRYQSIRSKTLAQALRRPHPTSNEARTLPASPTLPAIHVSLLYLFIATCFDQHLFTSTVQCPDNVLNVTSFQPHVRLRSRSYAKHA
jgi:hypothetical protein